MRGKKKWPKVNIAQKLHPRIKNRLLKLKTSLDIRNKNDSY